MTSIQSIVPKLPSTDLERTRSFYNRNLGFAQVGGTYPDYLMMARGTTEIHFFLFRDLRPLENYGMCYLRVLNIEHLHSEISQRISGISAPELKPWGQKEFSLIDPDHNLLTFGESVGE